jgi:hypothetical protein
MAPKDQSAALIDGLMSPRQLGRRFIRHGLFTLIIFW